jgi:hypothetical protein
MNELMEQLIDQLLSQCHLAFISLGTINEEVSTTLIQSLVSTPPSLDRELILNTVVEHNPDLDRDLLEELITVLLTIYNWCKKSDSYIDEITEQIVKSISANKEKFPGLAPDEVKLIGERLTSLLADNGTIATSYKSLTILKDHKCVFDSCQIFTDIRPVFGLDITDDPIGMGITHTLKIVYVGLDAADELFVTLDSSELERLRDEISRAISKEKSIRSMFDNADIHCL